MVFKKKKKREERDQITICKFASISVLLFLFIVIIIMAYKQRWLIYFDHFDIDHSGFIDAEDFAVIGKVIKLTYNQYDYFILIF